MNKILQLQITEWNYKKENASIRHIGLWHRTYTQFSNLEILINQFQASIHLVGVQVLAKAFKAQQQQMEANVRMFKTMQGEIEKIDMTFNDVKTNNHLGIKLDELHSDY